MTFEFQAELENLDAVPEELKTLYTEKDGKFLLSDSLKKKLDTSGLKQAYEREKGDAKKYKDMVKGFEKLGKSPEEIAEIMADFEARQQADAEKKGDFEKMKEQIVSKHKLELEDFEKKNKSLKSTLEKTLIEAEAVRQLADLKGNTTILLPHIKASTVVVEEEGEFVVRIIDAKGTPKVDGQGNYLTIKDLVTEMKASETFGCAFQGTGASGSGSRSDGQGGGNHNPNLSRAKMTAKEKSDYISKHGNSEFYKLPA
jgi:hypothetical protein